MHNETIRLAVGLIILATVNVILGGLDAFFESTFDWKKMLKGVLKGVVIIACFAGFYAAGRLAPDIISIELEGQIVNVATVANVSMTAAYAIYAKDVFMKLKKFVVGEVKTGVTEEDFAELIKPTEANEEDNEDMDEEEPPSQDQTGESAA